MKVLHAVEAFAGGVLQSVAMICWGLRDGIEFHILHGRRAETPADFASYFPASVCFTAWSAGRPVSPLRDLGALRELRRTIVEARPDVVHAHSSKAGALARMAQWRGAVPVIYSPRGYSFLRVDAGAAGRTAYRLAERVLGQLPHVSVACGVGEYVEASRVSRRAVLIPNMLNLADFEDLAAPRPSTGPLRVAMAGRISPQKNFPLFRSIAEALPTPGFELVWIGDGDRPAAPLPPNLAVTGWLPRRQVLEELSRCHVFAQTSLWEGLPIAMMEAMALGLAVLAMPCVGNTELVVEGETGYLCASRDAFVARLVELAGDRDRIAALGAAGRALVEREHDRDTIIRRWHSLYHHYPRYRDHG